jgi:hypothetical protein
VPFEILLSPSCESPCLACACFSQSVIQYSYSPHPIHTIHTSSSSSSTMPDEPGPYSPTAAPFTPSSSASASTFKGATPEIGERVNLPPSSVPCRFFLKGYCSRGSTCWYAHDVAAVPGVEDVVINTTAAVDEKGKCSASAAGESAGVDYCSGYFVCRIGPDH